MKVQFYRIPYIIIIMIIIVIIIIVFLYVLFLKISTQKNTNTVQAYRVGEKMLIAN